MQPKQQARLPTGAAKMIGCFGAGRSRAVTRPELKLAPDNGQLLARRGNAPRVALDAFGNDRFSAALLGNTLSVNAERVEVAVIEAGQPDRVLHRRPAPVAALSTVMPIFFARRLQ
jgi:hypothetical protein